jgi:hypothetical protein
MRMIEKDLIQTKRPEMAQRLSQIRAQAEAIVAERT